MLRCINRGPGRVPRRLHRSMGATRRAGGGRIAAAADAAFRSPVRVAIAHVDHASGFDAKKHPDARSDDDVRVAATGRRAIDACMRPFALRRRSHRFARGSCASMMRSDSIDAGIRESRRCACRRERRSCGRRVSASPCSAASITSCRSRIARVDDAHGFDRKKHPRKCGGISEKSCAHTHAVIATSKTTSTTISMRTCAADVGPAAVQGAIRSLETIRSEFNVCEMP